MALYIIDCYPNRARIREKSPKYTKSFPYQGKPFRMLNAIIIVIKGGSSIVGRIDENTPNLTCESLLQRLQRQQVVPKNQPIVKDVTVAHALCRVVRLLRILE